MADRQGRLPTCSEGWGWRSSVVLAGFAAVVLVAVLPAFADAPETGTDPTVTLTVTPSDGLSEGQVVTVTGAGFSPSTSGTVRECGGAGTTLECDVTVTAAFVTTASGIIPPTTLTVRRIIETGTTTFNCGVQSCALVASAGGRSSQHHIRMSGAGTSIPTSTSTTSSSTVPPSSAGATFTPLSPSRVWDSRFGPGPTGQVGPGETREITVTGTGGVPSASVTAVVLNVTAVGPSAATFVTAWPTGVPKPLASNLNVPAGDVRPNLVVVKVGTGGKISFANDAGSLDLIADVAGYYGGEPHCLPAQLAVTAIPDKAEFRPGEVVRVTSTVRNQTAAACSYSSFSFSHRITDATGQTLLGGILHADAFRAVALLPGETLTQSVEWNQRACATCAQAAPGRYGVTVSWSLETEPVEASTPFSLVP